MLLGRLRASEVKAPASEKASRAPWLPPAPCRMARRNHTQAESQAMNRTSSCAYKLLPLPKSSPLGSVPSWRFRRLLVVRHVQHVAALHGLQLGLLFLSGQHHTPRGTRNIWVQRAATETKCKGNTCVFGSRDSPCWMRSKGVVGEKGSNRKPKNYILTLLEI